MLDARKKISKKTINMSNKHREGKREELNPKPNNQKCQEAKQQWGSLTEVSGWKALGSCWPATPLQIWAVVRVLHTVAEEIRNPLKYSYRKRATNTPHLYDPPKEGKLNTCISWVGKLRQGEQQQAPEVVLF